MKKKCLCITLVLVVLLANINMASAWEVEDPYNINMPNEEIILNTL